MKTIGIEDFKLVDEHFGYIFYFRVDERCCATRYLIKKNRKTFLIDSGDGKDKLDFVPDICILTHAHYDHVSGIEDSWPKVMLYSKEDENLPYVNIPENVQRFDEKIIEFEGLKLQIIPTPGHTSGCISIFEPKSGILFTGDTKFANGAYGRTDLGGSDEQIKKSLKKIDDIEWRIICPGHGSIEYRDGKLI